MEYSPKPTGRPADYYIIGSVLGGAVFWVLTYFVKSYVALYQLISFALFAFAIYILTRYRLTLFRFRIEGRNGVVIDDIYLAMPDELDFVAERMRGKNPQTLARLSLDGLKSAKAVPYQNLRGLAGKASLYRYQADMSPETGVLLIFRGEGADTAIFTDLPTDMLDFLRKTVEVNVSSKAFGEEFDEF